MNIESIKSSICTVSVVFCMYVVKSTYADEISTS